MEALPAMKSKDEQLKNIEKGHAVFVYGSLRPDDNSGMLWTEEACEGMDWLKAEVHGVGLYKD